MKHEEKLDARDRLLAAGLKFFSSKGFDGATVRSICDEANSNIAAINYYFGDKQGFYSAVVEHAMEIRQKTMSRCWDLVESDPWEALALHVEIMLDEAYDEKMFQVSWLLFREILEQNDISHDKSSTKHQEQQDENRRLQYVERMSHLLGGLLGPKAATPENKTLLHYTYHSLCRFLPIKSEWEARVLRGKAQFSVKTTHDKETLKRHIIDIVRHVVEDMQRKAQAKDA